MSAAIGRLSLNFCNSLEDSAVRLILLIPVLIGMAMSAGCGDGKKYKTAPVAGTVTIDGKPIDGADVYFVGNGMNAVAKTDAQGKYELLQGAVVGENKVYFSKIVGGTLTQEEGIDAGQMEAMAAAQGPAGMRSGPKQMIPAEFSDPANMNITLMVPDEGTSSADFSLTSK